MGDEAMDTQKQPTHDHTGHYTAAGTQVVILGDSIAVVFAVILCSECGETRTDVQMVPLGKPKEGPSIAVPKIVR